MRRSETGFSESKLYSVHGYIMPRSESGYSESKFVYYAKILFSEFTYTVLCQDMKRVLASEYIVCTDLVLVGLNQQ